MTLKRHFKRRYAPPGSAPGTFTIDPRSEQPVISVFSYNADEFEERRGVTPAEASGLMRDGRITWIDVTGLGDERTLRDLAERFNMHPLALADVVNSGQRPKVEEYSERLFIVTRMAHLGADRQIERQEQVSILLGPGFVLTFQERQGDCFDPLRDRIRGKKGLVRTMGADYAACMILDSVVDGYFPLLETIGEVLEDLEEQVISAPTEETLARIFRLKRELMNIRRSIWPQRELLSVLLRDRHPLLSVEVTPYVRDAYDHAMHIVDVTETFRELAGSYVEVYLSSMSQRTNEAMRVLTVIATIFIPLTFLAGVYGMNFHTEKSPLSMPELGWKYGYLLFWLISCVVAGVSLYLFRKLGWLRVKR